MHALQSYLWNKAASHRVETYGIAEVRVGDLVLPLAADLQAPGTLPWKERGGGGPHSEAGWHMQSSA
jgi:tRNA(Glu) U13 pseudouridine synthase TruD